ncbi:signal peptidase I [Paramicrobacterium chengjingii]|uniref:signal peptidase I n=1 Tax=Paramicrobacterium chengjingii TaxID=2769067 RepID=UPI00141D93A5|nr:signal peptidase I [Microbacterium chengjingii]
MLLNVAAIAGLVCIVLVVLSMVFHISLIMFKTGSMSPTIPQGSVAVVKEIPASEIVVGDVVTVDREGQLPITHRVISVEGSGTERSITMQGDANDYPDPAPYEVTHVRTVLWSVPAIANVIVWMSNPFVLGGLTIGASILVTWAFWPRRGTSAKRRKQTEQREDSEQQGRSEHRERSGRHAGTTTLVATTILVGGLALAVAPTSAAHAADDTVTGDYISITTVGDDQAMTSLSPGVPVDWQVGITIDSPTAGEAVIDLSSRGDLDLDVSIRACTVKWVGKTCPGDESSVADVASLTGDQKNIELLAMPTAEQRWLLFTVSLPGDSHGSMVADVRVTANGESVSDSSEASTLPRTGTDLWLPLGLAIGAIVLGLLIAGIAARSRRKS